MVDSSSRGTSSPRLCRLDVALDAAEVGRWLAFAIWHCDRAASVKAVSFVREWLQVREQGNRRTLPLRCMLLHLTSQLGHFAPVSSTESLVEESQVSRALLRVGCFVEAHDGG